MTDLEKRTLRRAQGGSNFPSHPFDPSSVPEELIVDLTSPTSPSFSSPSIIRRRASHDIKADDEKSYWPGAGRSRSRSGRRRRLKRFMGYTMLLGCAWLILSTLSKAERIQDALKAGKMNISNLSLGLGRRHTCEFVSPVQAYHRDLIRLRALVADQEGFDSNFPLNLSVANHHHRFSDTGHMVVSDDPDDPHPIPLLLERGEKHWKELLSRQSKTLKEASVEYKRRYGRPPPRGFDTWWRAVEEHNLLLPDEYDRINLDLAPFFALPKAEMRRRMGIVRDMKETFTIMVKDGLVSVLIKDSGGLSWEGTLPRAKDAGSLINAFAQHLPDLNATFSIFDQPQIYLSWARRGSLVSLGLQGQHTQLLDETDDGNVRLSRSCPPESNFRTKPDMHEGRSFVYDSLAAVDLCQNPYVVPLHGLTIEPHTTDSHPRPHTQLLPLFSLAKTSINSDILITPLDQFYDKPGNDPKWRDKKSSRLMWRGSPTGISMMTKDLPWRNSHRVRLHTFANNRSEGMVQYMVPDLGQNEENEDVPDARRRRDQITFAAGENSEDGNGNGGTSDGSGRVGHLYESAPMRAATNFFIDAKLSGAPLQCDETDGTCQDMKDEIGWAKFQPSNVMNRYKFLLDVDGNGWSGRFRRLMSTNSLVIKTGLFTEWFQPHLIPWFMYVPAKLDYTDLFDILAFFRGTPHHPELGFDETAEALARNGQCFVKRMYRIQDLQAYMMRLFLEYARLVADDGEDMVSRGGIAILTWPGSINQGIEPKHQDFDYDRYETAMRREGGEDGQHHEKEEEDVGLQEDHAGQSDGEVYADDIGVNVREEREGLEDVK